MLKLFVLLTAIVCCNGQDATNAPEEDDKIFQVTENDNISNNDQSGYGSGDVPIGVTENDNIALSGVTDNHNIPQDYLGSGDGSEHIEDDYPHYLSGDHPGRFGDYLEVILKLALSKHGRNRLGDRYPFRRHRGRFEGIYPIGEGYERFDNYPFGYARLRFGDDPSASGDRPIGVTENDHVSIDNHPFGDGDVPIGVTENDHVSIDNHPFDFDKNAQHTPDGSGEEPQEEQK